MSRYLILDAIGMPVVHTHKENRKEVAEAYAVEYESIAEKVCEKNPGWTYVEASVASTRDLMADY